MLKQIFFRITGKSIAKELFAVRLKGTFLVSILLDMIRASSWKEMKIKINYTHKWIGNDFSSQKIGESIFTLAFTLMIKQRRYTKDLAISNGF